MDNLTFASEVVDSLAWPVAVLLLALLLRSPISDLIRLVSKVRFRGFEFETAQLRKDVETSTPQVSEHDPAIDTRIPDDIVSLAKVSPRTAILESWKLLESSVAEAASQFGMQVGDLATLSTADLVFRLKEAGHIPEEHSSFFMRAFAIRNQMVHAPDVELTTDQALNIIDVQNDLRVYFQRLAPAA